ncbi:MAG TPA: hypothetical protein VHK27_04055, partial [Gammaproteobacteria bacterium]|nr:hypothetical protein [Gammaproteobacteria bacterium]
GQGTGRQGHSPASGGRLMGVSKLCELDGCSGHPDLPDGWTSWQEALHASFTIVDVPGDRLGRWMAEEPVIRASSFGHNVFEDHPEGLSKVRRWTCLTCGRAVLRYEMNIYGTAVEVRCGE